MTVDKKENAFIQEQKRLGGWKQGARRASGCGLVETGGGKMQARDDMWTRWRPQALSRGNGNRGMEKDTKMTRGNTHGT